MNTDQNSGKWQKVASLFDTDTPVKSVKTFGNGLINTTLLVTTESGRRYILQKINTAIFLKPEELQQNLRHITDHIRRCNRETGKRDADRHVLTMVKTRDGKEFAEVDGEAWRMTQYVEGSHTEEKLTPEKARLTGKAFAEFHSFFARPDAPQLADTIPGFHDIALRIRQLREAIANDPVGRLAEVHDICDKLLARSEEMLLANRLHAEGKLPRRIAHHDTKLNNILFDEDGSILCVIDLDTVMPGFLLSDFGDFIRTGANTGAEDDPDLSRVGVDMDIFRAFAEGYIPEATFLTDEEKKTFPFGARMLTYMQTVRFLTDYINGDTYYKTLYPEHNLVRTRAQLRLLEELDRHAAEMDAIIASL